MDLTPELTIDEYRSLAGFSVPSYAPENFIPLVWSDYDEGTVKLLKFPAPSDPPQRQITKEELKVRKRLLTLAWVGLLMLTFSVTVNAAEFPKFHSLSKSKTE